MFSVRILTLLLYLSLAADSTGAAPVTMIRYRHALTGFISLHQFRDFLTAIVQYRRFSFFIEVGRGIEPLVVSSVSRIMLLQAVTHRVPGLPPGRF